MLTMSSKGDAIVSQWVAILPKADIIKTDNGDGPVFVKLRHPKTGKCAMFLMSNDGCRIYEVLVFKEKFKSWFIDETVQRDGSLQLSTPIDPLFLVLPYLIKAEQGGMFMTLDQIVSDDEFPQCIKLLNCCVASELEHISDVKGGAGLMAYRYNTESTLTWLEGKVQRVADKLEEKNIHVTSGAKSATFVRSSKGSGATKEDYLRFGFGLVADYLDISVAKELQTYLGIKEKENVEKVKNSEPPAKKMCFSKDLPEATEDYSKFFAGEKQKTTKLSTAQKVLQKADKTGMKRISSFFTKKSQT